MSLSVDHSSLSKFKLMNKLGRAKVPFLFIIDFEIKKPVVIPLEELPQHNLKFDINGYRNYSYFSDRLPAVNLEKYPMAYEAYKTSFENVSKHLRYGNSFLVNLTHKTRIHVDQGLESLFYQSKAKYKLLYEDQFLVFSPEIFIKIEEGMIRSFPMKGTIEKGIPNAEAKIINDPKELAEHVTIVDLIRNDLSHVADNVKVIRFRYIDEIRTNQKDLLQVSSEITGKLPVNYTGRIGDILLTLLPAGSVSGAPKEKTMEIIQDSEQEDRGYFTGIFGFFDGKNLDSGVMIRYVEKYEGNFYFRSGGGVTVNSNPESEYKELLDKIYVPFA